MLSQVVHIVTVWFQRVQIVNPGFTASAQYNATEVLV